MLINARQSEEIRIAITDDNKLIDLYIENINREQRKSNIYKGKISRIEPSLNALFINYGEEKNGFLPYKEISPEYFKKSEKDNVPLNELLDVGQEVIVQVSKEERGSKGAALTTYTTLAGCYMVLMPNNPNGGGISRRIEGDERRKLKTLFESLIIPKDMSIIIRTAGVDRSISEIQGDLDTLVSTWRSIQHISSQKKAPFLIHKESDITIRAVRDHLKRDIEEIVVDTKEAYDDLKSQLSVLRPQFKERLFLHSKRLPLFSSYQIENEIESAFKREINLLSGGSIVIDNTEALTAIDVNSARSTKGDNIEETALETNLEATVEIARQLRLRDLGGLIVIDFIDMASFPNQKAVEHQFIELLLKDRAKIQMTRISKFGLIEISRQRLQASLGEAVMSPCPRCQGHGLVRSVPSSALSIIRKIYSEALKDKTNEIRVQLPVEVATFLLNEKRNEIHSIEQICGVKILLIPNMNAQSSQFNVQRIWGEVYNSNKASFNLIEKEKDFALYKTPKLDKSKNQSALKPIQHNKEIIPGGTNIQDKSKDHSSRINKNNISKKEGLWRKIRAFFFSEELPKKNPQSQQKSHCQSKKNSKPRNQELQHKVDFRKDTNSYNKPRDHAKGRRRDNSLGNNNYDLSRGNKNTRPRQHTSNLQVHQSEEIIDINALRKKSPDFIKATREKNLIKNISTKTEEKISPMVKEILARKHLADTNGNYVQVNTNGAGKKIKHLIFKTITLDFEKNTKDVLSQEKENICNTMTSANERNILPAKNQEIDSKRSRPKQRQRRSSYVTYSSAVDTSSQGYVLMPLSKNNKELKYH